MPAIYASSRGQLADVEARKSFRFLLDDLDALHLRSPRAFAAEANKRVDRFRLPLEHGF